MKVGLQVLNFFNERSLKMESIEIKYLKLFRDVCKKINSSLDFSEVLKSITENTVKVLDVKACTIFLLDKKQKILKTNLFPVWRKSAALGLKMPECIIT